jgi:predicted lipoprotein with Yx(FWY)xxD motif
MRTTAVLLIALACTAGALASPQRAKVAARSTSLGTVLVDARGHTLYIFDAGRCSGACLATWPAFVTTGKPVAASGIPAAKLGTIKLANGTLQVTFAGHPLHFFAHDTKAGQVNGASMPHWWALSPSGARLRATSAATGTTPTATTPNYGGGGGY